MASYRFIDQRSPEWYAARCGRVTASRISDVMAQTKSGYGAGRRNYMAELLVERITGAPTENGFVSKEMQRGIDLEPEAVDVYEVYTGLDVKLIGFVEHSYLFAGASPDGLVGEDGLLEVKCPNTATHIDSMLGGPIDRKYYLQMQFQIDCAERQWCDFVSYDNRMPEAGRLYVVRVDRDEDTIRTIREEVELFDIELKRKVIEVQKKMEALES